MTKRVICVGNAVLDLIYGVDLLPGRDGKFRATSLLETGGGMAANGAVTVTRLGGAASWWGRLGDDARGLTILEGLRRENVDVAHVRVLPGAISSHSVVLSDKEGRRALILYRSDALEADPAWLPVEEIATAEAVLADNRWIEGTVLALGAARAAGRPAVLDADAGTGDRTHEAVAAASHAVFSETGLSELYDTEDPREGLRRALTQAPFAAVTLGSQGVLWASSAGDTGTIASFPVQAVETVGAGDVFHGAFAMALAEGRDEIASLRFASAAAALKCAAAGGRASFPDRAAVDRLAASV